MHFQARANVIMIMIQGLGSRAWKDAQSVPKNKNGKRPIPFNIRSNTFSKTTSVLRNCLPTFKWGELKAKLQFFNNDGCNRNVDKSLTIVKFFREKPL